MNLYIFLGLGDSFTNMAKSGQDIRFKKFYLTKFSDNFKKVYIFSYANEQVRDLPKNVVVIPNKFELSRFVYALIFPFINFQLFAKSDYVIRAYHLPGTIPAIVAKIFFGKKFAFNFAFDYYRFSLLEGKRIQALLLILLKPVAILLADCVFAANQRIFNEIKGKNVTYLPNGVDVNFFKPMKVRKTYDLLSVGRLEKQKNFDRLIKSLKGTKKRLKIVGQGSLKSKLLLLARKLNVDLTVVDKIENTNMPKIYNSTKIFVLPSKIEGHPKVLLEAMSCGVPTIGSDVEGINEIIINNKNGILLDATSSNLQKSILEFSKDLKLQSAFSKEARKDIKKKFNLTKLLEREILSIKQM